MLSLRDGRVLAPLETADEVLVLAHPLAHPPLAPSSMISAHLLWGWLYQQPVTGWQGKILDRGSTPEAKYLTCDLLVTDRTDLRSRDQIPEPEQWLSLMMEELS